jgi:hypothetical protein
MVRELRISLPDETFCYLELFVQGYIALLIAQIYDWKMETRSYHEEAEASKRGASF